jgi:hypothetical protein
MDGIDKRKKSLAQTYFRDGEIRDRREIDREEDRKIYTVKES